MWLQERLSYANAYAKPSERLEPDDQDYINCLRKRTVFSLYNNSRKEE